MKEVYEQSNQLFYTILNNLCTKGLVRSKIQSFNDQRDGALVWKNLKEYYDQDGGKQPFGTQALEQIFSLKLMYNSHGGFDNYMSKFEQCFIQMQEA